MVAPVYSLRFPVILFAILIQGVFLNILKAQTVIGGDTIDQSAILDLQDTAKGVLLTRLTTLQRDGIIKPAFGLLIMNTTLQCLEANFGSPEMPVWRCLTSGISQISQFDTASWNQKLGPSDTISLSERILKAGLPQTGNSPGNILYWDGTNWLRLPPGQNGQLLQLQNGMPAWAGPAFASVNTNPASGITPTSALVGGNISSDGGAGVTARGIVYGTTPNPTLENTVLAVGSGSGVFTATLSGLTGGTTYHVRAYAINSAGQAYGESLSFTTLPAATPSVSTLEITSVTPSGAMVAGNITNDGGATITQRGIVYGTSPNPTISDAFTVESGGLGTFTSSLTGLAANTTYYVRAYATNMAGTAYGNEGNFYTSESFRMVVVPSDTFLMGCNITLNEDCNSNETPRQYVNLSAFQIAETEVTAAQWQLVTGNNPGFFSGCGATCPVENVSWYDALVFCNRLSESQGLTPCYYTDAGFTQVFGKSGNTWSFPNAGNIYWNQAAKGYRLPTEAEWELAARAGGFFGFFGVVGNIFSYSGSNNIEEVGWYAYSVSTTLGPKPVKGKSPNAYGLFDMSGNVMEWCYDWFGIYKGIDQTNPVGPTTGVERVLRGGSWVSIAKSCRVASRSQLHPTLRDNNIGFRIAKTL